MIKAGIDINFQDINGSTAIHISAEHGTGLVADLLVKAKADLNIRDNNGSTPYKRAEASDYGSVFDRALIKNAKKVRYFYNYIEDDTDLLLEAAYEGTISKIMKTK